MDAAAAGIAFVQISTDIAKCVVKAHQLWQQIKDLPHEIQEMLADLEVFGAMFEDIQEQLEADATSLSRDDAPIKRSLKLARDAYVGLNDLVMDMSTTISTKRGLKKKAAMIRITVKKDKLDQYQQSRGTAKLTAKTHEGAGAQTGSYMNNKALISGSQKSAAARRAHAPSKLGRFALAYTKGTGAWQACIQWPSWLSGSIYEIESNPGFGGWMYNFRTYNIVPTNSEIILRIENGDKDGALELFNSGKASPFDKDEGGASLLSASSRSSSKEIVLMIWQYAAKSNSYETCKLLLRMGLHEPLAQPIERKEGGPLCMLVFGSYSPPGEKKEPEAVKETQRIAELFNSYLDEPESTTILRLFNYEEQWQYGGDYVKAYQQCFLPTLHTGSPRNRFDAFRLASFHMRSGYRTLRFFITNDREVTSDDVSQSTREQLSLVHSAAVALGIRWPDEILVPPNKKGFPIPYVYEESWSETIHKVASVAGGDDLHSIETVNPWDIYQVPIWRGTPLISVIGGALCYISPDKSFFHWDAVFQGTIRQWVLDLQIAGVDLTTYGRREALTLRDQMRGALDADAIEMSRNQIRNVMPNGSKTGRACEVESGGWNDNHWVPIRLLGLEVGPRPEDWRLEWVPEFEWMACQFWKLIEKENTVAMPGSWVE
ncbi:hypothetical protein G7Z17_g10200 [Cylindrodendrum hubeiense]|uniref:Uncharacterized protein n=1 Tax=Cylindrodendrum hubeiense TaxID=595255 RepID=A0A9P5H3G6_9HYPO|nr:hypothetical protein G7Z17_g10200 [Cylindrodendrum hubeiense]